MNNMHSRNERESGISHFLEGAGDLFLGYQLPKLVEAKQNRWLSTLKDSAITSAVLTLLSGQLVLFYKNGFSPPNHSRSLAISILSHLSFIFNLCAVFSSIVLANKLGRLTDVAARRDAAAPQEGYLSANRSFLKVYGFKTSWYLMAIQWVICFSFGIGCLLGQVMVYVWTDESLPVKIVTTCLITLALPPLVFVLFAD
ncbi:hypothetical protein L218DRAFT_219439 [Marasmius fiardii PR-910]|nr:hypothetical protein L218DRAFT_219439 [Marasmius fiardii PR-910]